MLTHDLVRATRRGNLLQVKPLSGKTRERALELGDQYWAIARDSVGRPREELDQEWDQVPTSPQEKKLGAGLRKLIEDACDFGETSALDPRALRSEVFLASALAWQQSALGSGFDRERILRQVAQKHGAGPESIEGSLFGDLRGAQRLLAVPDKDSAWLVSRYDAAQVQAVLLRAVIVRAKVRCRSADAYRSLFQKLKFRRLLFRLEPAEDGAYVIELDGPMSLFENVTKYGLALALVLPALQRAEKLELRALVKWGKARQPMTFEYESRRSDSEIEAENRLSDELVELVTGFHALESGYRVAVATRLIDLPGVGTSVPDLEFTSPEGVKIYFELLGFWSRDAVWKRIEIAKQGLEERMLFAVSSRLRVSEKNLGEDDPAGLYVFKGVMNPKAVLRRLEELVKRA